MRIELTNHQSECDVIIIRGVGCATIVFVMLLAFLSGIIAVTLW